MNDHVAFLQFALVLSILLNVFFGAMIWMRVWESHAEETNPIDLNDIKNKLREKIARSSAP